jgi:hypothetical protein
MEPKDGLGLQRAGTYFPDSRHVVGWGSYKRARIRWMVGAAMMALCWLAGAPGNAQQTEIRRYDAYAGFTDIDAPDLGLNQQGFHGQVGMNVRPWYSVGFDYSVVSGSELLTTALLPAALQAQVNAAQQQFIALGLLPPNYILQVPTDAFTQTFAFGPQLVLFARPSLGALRERATPHPADPFQKLVVQELAPAGYKLDWTGFYGIGGGADVRVNKWLGVRGQFDAVYNHPFNDILANGRWTYRYSIGPSFHFGRNIAH